MSISINTQDFIKGKKVLIDGMSWQYVTPGAGVMLDISKASRESESIQKKLDDGTATEADRKKQEKLIDLAFEFYGSVLKDNTKDNSQVRKWLRETPMDTIAMIVQEIQKQSD